VYLAPVSALLALLLTAAPLDPAGLAVIGSGCPGGGWDHWFFAGGQVLARCVGCAQAPLVQKGRWYLERDGAVRVRMDVEWAGEQRGPSTERYAAVWVRGVETYRARFPAEAFDLGPRAEGCERAERHARPPRANELLWQFEGEHPETGRRLVEPAELAGRTPEELRRMWREIFARYGQGYDDPALEAYWAAREPGYRPALAYVEPFLSGIERENARRLAIATRLASPLVLAWEAEGRAGLGVGGIVLGAATRLRTGPVLAGLAGEVAFLPFEYFGPASPEPQVDLLGRAYGMATLGARVERAPSTMPLPWPSRFELEVELGWQSVNTGINLPDPEDSTRGEYTHHGRSSPFAGLRCAVGWPAYRVAASVGLSLRQELGGPRRACALDVCERSFGTTGSLTFSFTSEARRWPALAD